MKDSSKVGVKLSEREGGALAMGAACWLQTQELGGASLFSSLRVGLTSSTKDAGLGTKAIVCLSHRGMDQLTFFVGRGP